MICLCSIGILSGKEGERNFSRGLVSCAEIKPNVVDDSGGRPAVSAFLILSPGDTANFECVASCDDGIADE